MTTYSAGDGRIIIRCDVGQCITQVTVTAPNGETARAIAAGHNYGWYRRRHRNKVVDACQWHLGACCIHHTRPDSPTLDPAAILPAPRLEPMSSEAAAWVREQVWLPFMRRQVWGGPTGYTYDAALAASVCECMAGVCGMCHGGRHDLCDRRKVRPRPEWWLANRPLDYIPPTAVWYADRACRPLCPCDCSTPKPKPVYEAVALPGLELIGVTT